MQNDAMKGKGYGTQAGRLAVKAAFDELGMAAVNADTIKKNTRSQYVLEKVGFRFVREDEASKYYHIEQYTPICRTDKGGTLLYTFRCTVRASLASPFGRGGRAQRGRRG